MIWCGLDIATAFSETISERFPQETQHPPIYFLCSESTNSLCLSLIDDCIGGIPESHVLTIADGEAGKTLQTCETIFNWLSENRALRNAILINVGGGALSDVGGFCASTYLRGIEFWNIPTTLLSMVDASVGGKTGINLNHHKNYIGTFTQPKWVFISPQWLQTLSEKELFSGWAEVIKHGIIAGGNHYDQVLGNLPSVYDHPSWLQILQWNVKLKSKIVASDFTEKSERKLLNLGHTVGHAIESWSHDVGRPVTHGHAIAWGLLIETGLSVGGMVNEKGELQSVDSESTLNGASKYLYDSLKQTIVANYANIHFTLADIPKLLNYIKADKKNENNTLLFSLAFAPGECRYNIVVNLKDIELQLQKHMAAFNTPEV